MLIHFNREKDLNPLNLENNLLEDRSFIDNPNSILEPPSLTPKSQPKALNLASSNFAEYGKPNIDSLER